MTVGDRLQAADVGVGALSLRVTSISAYLTWNAAMVCHFLNFIPGQLANDASLAQSRRWQQHLQVLPVYHPQALPPINNRRAALLLRSTWAFTGCLAAFVRRTAAGLVS
jgi:hypothetical protein